MREVERTLDKPYFRARLTPAQIAAAVALLRRQAAITAIAAQVSGVATHPEDDLVLATALSANAGYLVTGDEQLQKLGNYQGVQIVSPRAFLDVLTP
jgi:predicted nucleic acid-binding protein